MKNKFIINKNLIITFCIFFMILTLFTIAALIPRSLIEYIPPGGDDFVHVYIFSILSLLLCFSKIIDKKYIYLILFFYGFLIEILQLIMSRNFSYLDISYNFIGISLGISFYFFVNKIITLKKKKNSC
tara:strand:+ start:80 stop:463 length:384 start_codon:yes stop_codon:yes gene_type:complete